ncbi:DUF2326 domain-containing protein [Paenibacillus sp. FSL K6-1566]|uniref:DUF2326 domain-containing protein n=1 Tax=Paenibacillus TaxID=44249 RepID=UPI00203F38FD|nr:DUF2326 domain-containing protein [Paenibacillus lactis]MCM3493808.1 DUF2326 domain-containing protein [Paenibacillus lactis]
MLKQIRCDVFREKTIDFHPGLNVVLGDNQGSNSIGKSTLLMIIDFIFGGTSYTEYNNDVMRELGDHEFQFFFEFSTEKFFFIRGTVNPKEVYECNESFDKINTMTLEEYLKFLKKQYSLPSEHLSFRSAVSLYSRIWGKHNLDVKRPLHTFPKERNADTVVRFLLLFNAYDNIIHEEKKLKLLKDSRLTLNKAGKYDYVPKITKTKYEKNLKEIEEIEEKITDIKENIYKVALNISDFVSEELFNLQKEKNKLIKERDYFRTKLIRINKNLKNKHVDQKFEKLVEFFPNVNLEKLMNIERFHENISKILAEELKKEKRRLELEVNFFDEQISKIDSTMNSLLSNDGQSNHLIEHLFDLSTRLRSIELENKIYLKSQNIKKDIETTETDISEKKVQSIEKVTDLVNTKLLTINDSIHNESRRSPKLELLEKDYNYKIFDNTGTGKAYTNLLILDLAVFELTKLPILIHDSILFKNIEDNVVENIIKIYNQKSTRQIFIAIDTIDRYSEYTQIILTEQKAISLSRDRLLFIKDWR